MDLESLECCLFYIPFNVLPLIERVWLRLTFGDQSNFTICCEFSTPVSTMNCVSSGVPVLCISKFSCACVLSLERMHYKCVADLTFRKWVKHR